MDSDWGRYSMLTSGLHMQAHNTYINMPVCPHVSHSTHTSTLLNKVWNRAVKSNGNSSQLPSNKLWLCLFWIFQYFYFLKPWPLAHSQPSWLLRMLNEHSAPYLNTRVCQGLPTVPMIICLEKNDILCFGVTHFQDWCPGWELLHEIQPIPRTVLPPFRNVILCKCSPEPGSGRPPECLSDLPWTKLSDTLNSPGIPELFILLQLPEHQRSPGRFLQFDVTSSQVAEEAAKHPIA